jgi:NAD(P)-dependent dehydrogenase (short-subunit alcohol dehydrogenase family)
MDLDMCGKVVIVSGASSGIGLATAHRLLEEGAVVCGFARGLSRLQSAYRRQPGDRDRVLLLAGDASNADDTARIVSATIGKFGRIDSLVINAGQGVIAGIDADPALWTGQFETKLYGALHLVNAARAELARNAGASIVIVNAITAHHPDDTMAPVSAARAALASYASMLARSLAADDVRVTVVNVGAIITDRQHAKYLASKSDTSYEQWLRHEARRRKIPIGRLGTAKEVADTITFLLSPRSSYTTGTSIDVSGGLNGRT